MSSSLISSSSSDVPETPRPFAGLLNVPCRVEVVLGTGTISVREVWRLGPQSVIRLEQSAGIDLEVRTHGVTVAHGEVDIVDDSTAIRITQLVPPPGIEESLG
jgi:flagellar motor switch protein FliN